MDRIGAALRSGLQLLEDLQDNPFFTYVPRDENGERWLDQNGEPVAQVNIPCIEESITTDTEIEIGGSVIRLRKRLIVQGQRFLRAGDRITTVDEWTLQSYPPPFVGPPPQSGQIINFPGPDGPEYRVVQVKEGPGRGHLILELVDSTSSRG